MMVMGWGWNWDQSAGKKKKILAGKPVILRDCRGKTH